MELFGYPGRAFNLHLLPFLRRIIQGPCLQNSLNLAQKSKEFAYLEPGKQAKDIIHDDNIN